MKYTMLILLISMSLALYSCNKGLDSPLGFSLPKGDSKIGERVFLEYKCLACHSLKGIEDSSIAQNKNISVLIGSDKTHLVTYAELVTSIINPSHKFSRLYSDIEKTSEGVSKMKNFNDVITVTELIDLVAFLHPYYEFIPYGQTKYQYYPQ
ncbi:MAG TPA: cytochrome C [Colwellia sp.]|nr:cytochrome C [Colwellia sp.]